VPEIGFIVTIPSRAHGDMAGRHDREGPVRSALVLEKSAEPRERCGGGIRLDARGEVAPDDEVRAFAQPDLVRDHPSHDRGVVVVGDVEAGPVQRDRGIGKLGQSLAPVDQSAVADDQAAQRRAVVMALEAAFAHLAERHERQHLLRLACGIRERDVGEQIHVDHVAGEQLDRRALTRDERERDAALGELEQRREFVRGGQCRPGHRRSFVVGAVALRRRPPGGGLWSREHTA
jgi:hypothetical protein